MLIGAYFTQEYCAGIGRALQSVDGLAPGPVGARARLAAVPARAFAPPAKGISRRSPSAAARSTAECRIRMDEPTRFVTAPEQVPNTLYDKNSVLPQAARAAASTARSSARSWARSAISSRSNSSSSPSPPPCTRAGRATIENEPVVQGMLTLAKANYEISFSPEQHISERVVFPLFAHRGQRHRRRPLRRSSTTTTARSAITPRTPPSTAR